MWDQGWGRERGVRDWESGKYITPRCDCSHHDKIKKANSQTASSVFSVSSSPIHILPSSLSPPPTGACAPPLHTTIDHSVDHRCRGPHTDREVAHRRHRYRPPAILSPPLLPPHGNFFPKVMWYFNVIIWDVVCVDGLYRDYGIYRVWESLILGPTLDCDKKIKHGFCRWSRSQQRYL